ncbi:hypothetical protein [Paracoccus salsus]|uniref:hypothetical protein n=1 Tax=Paracoccus salsus TaxID=2911061 RepID=UPI001F34EDF0|nr:hypothetical protein [Paracoccus salsus]MCF3972175.1 hypothetical protein [Paracoccus salsus]
MAHFLLSVSLIANAAAAMFGVLAAYFWLNASRAKVIPKDRPSPDGWFDAAIITHGADGEAIEAIDTLMLQSKLNGRGALWGALAAGSLAIAQLCQVVIWFARSGAA